jgi:hypothetical protein
MGNRFVRSVVHGRPPSIPNSAAAGATMREKSVDKNPAIMPGYSAKLKGISDNGRIHCRTGIEKQPTTQFVNDLKFIFVGLLVIRVIRLQVSF